MFNGTTHYKWQFSIAMLNYQMVVVYDLQLHSWVIRNGALHHVGQRVSHRVKTIQMYTGPWNDGTPTSKIEVVIAATSLHKATVMARNTSYKYWTNPIYRIYNPIYNQLYLINGHNCR